MSPSEVVEAEETERDASRSRARRMRARYWTRFALGGGMGVANLINERVEAWIFSAHVGLRQQLGETIGLHAQLSAGVGSDSQQDGLGNRKQLSVTEAAASLSPYFGPFGRFYVGPALLVGYRWCSDSFVDSFGSSTSTRDHLIHEGGVRAGLLAGSEEQFDITLLLTTSFDNDTPRRVLVGFSYEFR